MPSQAPCVTVAGSECREHDRRYWKAIHPKKLDGEVYHMKFPGPAVHAKQARGAMVRYMCEAAVTAPEGLKGARGSATPQATAPTVCACMTSEKSSRAFSGTAWT